APVGFQCRECVKGAPAVRTLRSLRRDPYLTYALIAVNVAVFVASSRGTDQFSQLGLWGPAVAAGDWWRIVTSGFIHLDILHIGFNMFLLWRLGEVLESAVGRLRFASLYAAALLTGSLGVLLLQPNSTAGGASGAVFGLMGAAFLLLRRRGFDPMAGNLGPLILINLLLSFRPGVSFGAHLGGLAGGLLVGAVYAGAEDRHLPSWMAGAAAAAVAVVAGGACLYVAGHPL
ncbi:MAG: rhomboid family intrarane serine protease, partial [Actinomycetia bacterium]|nr:rhomboid family intrarane serine protease [Actinomycetes bacterium]